MGSDFSYKGGDRLQGVLKDLARKAGRELTLRVGFLEGSTCGRDNQSSAPNVAALLEYGTSRMPARPFFQQMIDQKSPKWPDAIVKLDKAYDHDFERVMQAMGERIKDQLVDAIETFTDPGLADSTKAKKGFDTPLQDSKNMKFAATYELQVDGEVVK